MSLHAWHRLASTSAGCIIENGTRDLAWSRSASDGSHRIRAPHSMYPLSVWRPQRSQFWPWTGPSFAIETACLTGTVSKLPARAHVHGPAKVPLLVASAVCRRGRSNASADA